MKNFSKIVIVQLLALSTVAYAAKNDGSDISACSGVTNVCMAAAVTDAKTGKSGYQPGEYKEGTGLWANCVGPLAKGKQVPGVTGVSQQAAQACLTAYKAANPAKK